MKELEIFFKDLNNSSSYEEILESFKSIKEESIDVINWDNFDYKPLVQFKTIYSEFAIYIQYIVNEKTTLGKRGCVNDPVYKDSCVEFFVSEDSNIYYNFEFNCIGTKYVGSGTSRHDGKTMESKYVETIRTFPSLGRRCFDEKTLNSNWELIVEIPFSLFTKKPYNKIKGSSMRANFYKCGDELTVPHYVTWNNIKSDKPDFHRPESFGLINFL